LAYVVLSLYGEIAAFVACGIVDQDTASWLGRQCNRRRTATLAPASIPLGRIAEVEEVADLVTYLASPKAHFVNGTMIEIDGGQMKPIMDARRDRV
jgi:NAD(P)-dependent dehydrogenase (short-subunit alcohol dehydrogenase family)